MKAKIHLYLERHTMHEDETCTIRSILQDACVFVIAEDLCMTEILGGGGKDLGTRLG